MLHLIVRSRNFSCKPLREIEVKRRTILRLGSTTPTATIARENNYKGKYIEINSEEACRNSGDKRIMKKHFLHAGVPTAEFFIFTDKCKNPYDKLIYYLGKWKKLIIKRYNSSKGNNIYLIQNKDDIKSFLDTVKEPLDNYIVEKYYNYVKEYRIHVTNDGYFHASRKMLKQDAVDRWHRHDNNSVWIKEDNELFDTPSSWWFIIDACICALRSLHLDIAAFDVKVQHPKDENEFANFIILESNSAPAMGDNTIVKYKDAINKILTKYDSI